MSTSPRPNAEGNNDARAMAANTAAPANGPDPTQNTTDTGSCACARCGDRSAALGRLHPDDLARIVQAVGEAASVDVGDLADAIVGPLAAALEQRVPRVQEEPLVDAAGLAERLGVTAGWVREHAGELGGYRLGTGPRPRWRFDVAEATEAYGARSTREGSRGSTVVDRPAGERRMGGRRRRAAEPSAQRVAIPAWEE